MDVTANQPDGTPTWIDLGVPDVERAAAFYRAVFGWEIEIGPAETGYYSMCLLRGKAVAALSTPPGLAEDRPPVWTMYFASSDVDGTAKRVTDAGGTLLMPPMDVMTAGRMALAADPTGAPFGLWQGRDHIGCQLVNEPNTLLRNDLVTADLKAAGDFYASVFDFTLGGADPKMPEVEFRSLLRPDGHDIGGIMRHGDARSSQWTTMFLVDSADATARATTEAGGSCQNVEDTPYGRVAVLTDPFGAEFSVGSAPS